MRKKPQIISIIIATLLALLTVLVGLLSSVASNNIPSLVTPYLRYTWPILGIATLALVGLTIWQIMRQSPDENEQPLVRSQHRQQLIEKQNRQRMIEKVRAFWIKGVLEQSLHGAALIELGLTEQPDAVVNPWRLVLQQPDQTTHSLPPGTHITRVFDHIGGELLILGEPGSGKTTLLLELARDLLGRAEKEESYPIPVVFNLSSWAVKRQPLATWLVEEMNLKYQVPSKLGQFWVDGDQILPLLDGLDEVSATYRDNCIEAINQYRLDHGIIPIAICSRSNDYLEQEMKVLLRTAVIVQPITPQQIDDYLSSAGGQLAALRLTLCDDKDLQEIATSPLMLSVLTLAYYGKPVEDLLVTGSPDIRRRQIFATYVHHMLQRRGAKTRYAPEQTIHWLAWLAQQIIQHSQTEFYFEQMQPDWLPPGWSRWLYRHLVWMLNVPIVGLGFELSLKLSNKLSVSWSMPVLTGLGSLIGLPRRVESEIKFAEVITWSWTGMWRSLVESLRKKLINVLGLGVGFGLLIGLTHGLLSGLASGLLTLLAVGLLLGLPTGLIGGLSYEMLNGHHRIKPDQGIWNSARNSMLFGLFSGLLIGLIFGLLVGLIGMLLVGLLKGLIIGLIGGLLVGLGAGVPVGLLTGGGACIEHANLRLLLWLAGCTPSNYIHFLDYAADRILLRKVGGGYIFIHRLLLEYFASLDDGPISSKMVDRERDSISAP